jgi:hypothetical protein
MCRLHYYLVLIWTVGYSYRLPVQDLLSGTYVTNASISRWGYDKGTISLKDQTKYTWHLGKEPTEFLAGSYVLVKYRTGKPPTRAHTFWEAHLEWLVMTNQSTITWFSSKKTKPYHVSDMKQLYLTLFKRILWISLEEIIWIFSSKKFSIWGGY